MIPVDRNSHLTIAAHTMKLDHAQVVLITTTLARCDEKYQELRARLALKTIRAARKLHYQFIAIDGGSPPEYVARMIDYGAHVYPQKFHGMGGCRRQAFRAGLDLRVNGQQVRAIVWLEPEKYTLVTLLRRPLRTFIERELDLVMLRRRSLSSYPPEQAAFYRMARFAFTYLSGMKLDYAFGPVIVSPRAAQFFLDYQSTSGDLWDSIHIPKLQIMKAGLRSAELTIPYVHPRAQTRAETGNLGLLERRINQLTNLIASVRDELQK